MHRVRELGGDRPEPRRFFRRRTGPEDAADLAAIVVEYNEVVVLAELGGLKRQHEEPLARRWRACCLTMLSVRRICSAFGLRQKRLDPFEWHAVEMIHGDIKSRID